MSNRELIVILTALIVLSNATLGYQVASVDVFVLRGHTIGLWITTLSIILYLSFTHQFKS